jgi:hypothetical protein
MQETLVTTHLQMSEFAPHSSASRATDLSLCTLLAQERRRGQTFLFFPYVSVFFFADVSGTLSLLARALNSAADRSSEIADEDAAVAFDRRGCLPGKRGAAAATAVSQNVLVSLSPT